MICAAVMLRFVFNKQVILAHGLGLQVCLYIRATDLEHWPGPSSSKARFTTSKWNSFLSHLIDYCTAVNACAKNDERTTFAPSGVLTVAHLEGRPASGRT